MNYGCGFSPGDGWLNFDSSPTLRFERIPLLGKVYTKNEQRFPANVMYGDIVKGPLCPPNEAAGVFASHVLEHLTYSDFSIALKHTWIMLKPSGIFRLLRWLPIHGEHSITQEGWHHGVETQRR